MTIISTPIEVVRAWRELANFGSLIRRADVSDWVKRRNAAPQYHGAFAAIVAVEGRVGVDDPMAIELRGCLRQLRSEATDAGLLTPAEIISAENDALNYLDH